MRTRRKQIDRKTAFDGNLTATQLINQPRAFIVQAAVEETADPSPEQVDLQTQLLQAQDSGYNFAQLQVQPTTSRIIQPKLTIGSPNDKHEHEADSVAQKVVQRINSPASNLAQKQTIQRQENPEEEVQAKPLADSIQREEMPEEEVQAKPLADSIQREEMPEEEVQAKPLADSIQREEMPEEEVQAKPLADSIQREEMPEDEEVQAKAAEQPNSVRGGMQAPTSVESSIEQSRGSGKPLDDSIKQPMEQAFGTNFSGVKIHTDARSDQLSRSINAQAFTTKNDIFFKQGSYNPESRQGQELLAHELTHVVQQAGNIPIQKRSQSFQDQKSLINPKQTSSIAVTSHNTPNIQCDGEEGDFLRVSPTLREEIINYLRTKAYIADQSIVKGHNTNHFYLFESFKNLSPELQDKVIIKICNGVPTELDQKTKAYFKTWAGRKLNTGAIDWEKLSKAIITVKNDSGQGLLQQKFPSNASTQSYNGSYQQQLLNVPEKSFMQQVDGLIMDQAHEYFQKPDDTTYHQTDRWVDAADKAKGISIGVAQQIFKNNPTNTFVGEGLNIVKAGYDYYQADQRKGVAQNINEKLGDKNMTGLAAYSTQKVQEMNKTKAATSIAKSSAMIGATLMFGSATMGLGLPIVAVAGGILQAVKFLFEWCKGKKAKADVVDRLLEIHEQKYNRDLTRNMLLKKHGYADVNMCYQDFMGAASDHLYIEGVVNGNSDAVELIVGGLGFKIIRSEKPFQPTPDKIFKQLSI